MARANCRRVLALPGLPATRPVFVAAVAAPRVPTACAQPVAASARVPLFPAPRLRAKPVRTASGIAVVAVMSKPHRCPHIATTGNICVYCPGGPDSDFEYSTQSYTGGGARAGGAATLGCLSG